MERSLQFQRDREEEGERGGQERTEGPGQGWGFRYGGALVVGSQELST